MSSWSEERRRNMAADREQARLDVKERAAIRREDLNAAAELRREERRKDREERRQDNAQRRRDRAQRRQARVAKRERTLMPGNVYRKGTLALVALSALASLPAQIIHFVTISWMLLPIGPALEGAAWVMAAGVAYADERKLPAWVRWLLRALSMGAAGFAANVNYQYGASLTQHGLSETDAQLVGLGLAAVTMGGPLFFEVRQWVLTLTAAVTDPRKRAEEKARAKHDRRRRRDHRLVVELARTLVSAAPYGALDFEDAFASAWEITSGTRTPGMTPQLHAQAQASRAALAAALDAANGSPVSVRGRLLENLHPAPVLRSLKPSKPQVVTDLSPASEAPRGKPKKGVRGKPPVHRRTKGDSVPFHPLAKTQHSHEARQRLTVNGHHH